MDSISKALVVAIQYLGSERNDDEYTEEDDLKIVEEVAFLIQEASGSEKSALINAAKELGLHKWASNVGIK